jgi:hypothetical protein
MYRCASFSVVAAYNLKVARKNTSHSFELALLASEFRVPLRAFYNAIADSVEYWYLKKLWL